MFRLDKEFHLQLIVPSQHLLLWIRKLFCSRYRISRILAFCKKIFRTVRTDITYGGTDQIIVHFACNALSHSNKDKFVENFITLDWFYLKFWAIIWCWFGMWNLIFYFKKLNLSLSNAKVVCFVLERTKHHVFSLYLNSIALFSLFSFPVESFLYFKF